MMMMMMRMRIGTMMMMMMMMVVMMTMMIMTMMMMTMTMMMMMMMMVMVGQHHWPALLTPLASSTGHHRWSVTLAGTIGQDSSLQAASGFACSVASLSLFPNHHLPGHHNFRGKVLADRQFD